MYYNNRMTKTIERTQTGIRVETRLLKVLEALAGNLNMTVGDLIEGILLHVFENKVPFSEGTLKIIAQLRDVHGLDLVAADSHTLVETEE